MKIPVSSRVFRKESQQVVAADRHEPHNINPNRPALTRRQDIDVGPLLAHTIRKTYVIFQSIWKITEENTS